MLKLVLGANHIVQPYITAFFGYIFRYFLHGLQHKGHLVDSPVDIKDLKSRLMGDTRYEEVSAACIWSEKVIDDLHTDFNQRAPTNVTVGILINGDETVDAYFGMGSVAIGPPSAFVSLVAGLLLHSVQSYLVRSGRRLQLLSTYLTVCGLTSWEPRTISLMLRS